MSTTLDPEAREYTDAWECMPMCRPSDPAVPNEDDTIDYPSLPDTIPACRLYHMGEPARPSTGPLHFGIGAGPTMMSALAKAEADLSGTLRGRPLSTPACDACRERLLDQRSRVNQWSGPAGFTSILWGEWT